MVRRFTMIKASISACLVLCAACMPQSVAAQGRLEMARSAVRGSSSSSSSDSSSGSDSSYDSSSSDDDDDDDSQRRPSSRRPSSGWSRPRQILRFLSYPYQGGLGGHTIITTTRSVSDELASGVSEQHHVGQDFSVRLGGEYGYGLYDVHRPSIYFLWDTHVRLGFDAGMTFMLERLPDGQLDNLNVGDLNLFYRVMSHPRAQMRFGLGWRYMIDAIGVENGFNLTFALDLFLIRPMVISANADVGNLGKALFFHGRLTIGAIIKRVEVFAGYEVMIIGPVPFHGPVAGMRIWL